MNQDIAVIGMACRFPGADSVGQFWANLVAGTESITRLSTREVTPGCVPAAALLEGHDLFDAAFFGYSPREAALLDPQQRVFLECAWTALEHAGHAAGGAVGVYAGAALNTYLLHTGLVRKLTDDYVLTLIANDKDFLSSRVSYKLDLTGPSVSVQTACSTSLVAVHLACQALLNGECDIALAGGVSVRVPQRAGYRFEPDGPLSPDGHCRAFDSRAQGTVLGSGVGVVVLRPLADALADGDQVYAVVKGSAVNNDGSSKVDYAAPSVAGQAEVVAEALAHAGVEPGTVSYVEAHGTGTAVGDPIEIAALTKAFRLGTPGTRFCAIGSVKTNIGHLDAAAGVAGLIKTVLALHHGLIPPSLHYERPNPKIDFAGTPFHVSVAPIPWPKWATPCRAGVSSLGIGGTNAHVILEAFGPDNAAAGLGVIGTKPRELIVLSAKTRTALDAATRNLRDHLAGEAGDSVLADVAHTLRVGRKAFSHRRMLACHDVGEAVAALEDARTSFAEPKFRPVAFLFPGGGSRRPPDVSELYDTEPVFRARIDEGVEEFGLSLTPDLADYARPTTQLPLIFLVEVALAELWMSWGTKPTAMLGHSMGELTAAHLGGVMTFRDALRLVVVRAELAERTPRGAMLSVPMPEHELVPLLGDDLDLAAINTPDSCVVSGTVEAIDALELVDATRVPVDSAGHSRLFDPFLAEYEKHVAAIELSPPSIPFCANLTGTWITDEQATDPGYWARQYRHTVRFADCATELLRHPDRLFVEVGPGQTLSGLVRAQGRGRTLIASLAPSMLDALGKLWLSGGDVDWTGFAAHERRRRVSLPTYPFERRRHWYEPDRPGVGSRVRSVLRSFSLPRRRKPEPQLNQEVVVAPRTPTERAVAEIWQGALGVDAVSIHDDFFELGGGSLLVPKVIRQVNQRFGIELSFLTMVESPTVAGLAECVDAVRGETT
ncbi:MAG: type I polyketide synthase [Chloroflexi bacterium]|nr:type I polyketide synthase [Acidobacteriota bacterium]MCA1587945.1 type I polyketide synthase [Chloroflexota bacterium]MCA1719576.1 type I polyketide synthase [Actinomycetota bacterium]